MLFAEACVQQGTVLTSGACSCQLASAFKLLRRGISSSASVPNRVRRKISARPAHSNKQAAPAWESPFGRSEGYAFQGRRPRREVGSDGIEAPLDSPLDAEQQSDPPSGNGNAGSAAQDSDLQSADSQVDSLRDRLLNSGITLSSFTPGEHRTVCPICSGGSTRERCLGVTIKEGGREAVWNCFRAKCGWKGSESVRRAPRQVARGRSAGKSSTAQPVKPKANLVPLEEEALEFFRSRGISAQTLEACGVRQENDVFCPALGKRVPWAIAFPYYRSGEIVNIKYRTPDKRFWQVKGAEKVFYGLDDVTGSDEIIIVEGEIDKLSLYEAGMTNAISVPDGAPPQRNDNSPLPPEQDKKYSYMWNCRDVLDSAIRVVLATDNDNPGQALGEELSRRLGRERCYRVRWPTTLEDTIVLDDTAEEGGQGDDPGDGAEAADVNRFFRKDANEVLVKDGAAMLQAYIDSAEEYPIRGLFRLTDFWGDVYNYYNLHSGNEGGVSTGWRELDQYYKIVPGELSIVTGVPNSGKSEWLDALCINLAEQHNWTFAMCSMEKGVKDHARQLLEKHVRKPFFDLPYAGSTKRMGWEEVVEGMSWIDERIFLIRYEDDELPNIDWVLNLARAAVLRHGIRGLVIDPYNELDHQRPSSMTETEYVSQMLTKIKRFAQHHECHVWFVAHPRQLREWKGEPPNLYDISGSAHFINKADCGIVIHRNRDEEKGPMNESRVLVRKIRNKAAGNIGESVLHYDRVTGRFYEPKSSPAESTQSTDFMSAVEKFNAAF
uniref:Twinkle protein n=1 Tax=Tetraselmis sp. GSL018 TaxID=582737 RepID=A0A061S6G6_9CHLO|eukprot:CAMPEP_0177597404 /NCGR_PEP_ID=MMETSP0419_2-20121207/11690_1 /TAXON_ID=582737 /ORGANISM="Tetraselmis sp., Strain GSL018" /LENGTH=776 /DNA_ID=CAMNT_0019089565 /DNA_START=207 /DNA_END=2537 /DNA_ORIENTATION=-